MCVYWNWDRYWYSCMYVHYWMERYNQKIAMDIKQVVLKKLENDKNFRERRNKTAGIAAILQEKYHLSSNNKIAHDPKYFAEILTDAESMTRYWRMILKERRDLRGSDYGEEDGTKESVEQNYEISLGYSPGYSEDLKMKTLF